jgi:hypothetical protein
MQLAGLSVSWFLPAWERQTVEYLADSQLGFLGECVDLQPHSHCYQGLYTGSIPSDIPCSTLLSSLFWHARHRCRLWCLGSLLKCFHLQPHLVLLGQVRSWWTLHEYACRMGRKCWCQHRSRSCYLHHAIVCCSNCANTKGSEEGLVDYVRTGSWVSKVECY